MHVRIQLRHEVVAALLRPSAVELGGSTGSSSEAPAPPSTSKTLAPSEVSHPELGQPAAGQPALPLERVRLARIAELESRIAEMNAEESPLARIVDRIRFQRLQPLQPLPSIPSGP